LFFLEGGSKGGSNKVATKNITPPKKKKKKEKEKDKGEEERIKEFQLFFTSSHVWSLEL
jgi:hypothetical protein